MLYEDLCKSLKPGTTIILVNIFSEQIDLEDSSNLSGCWNDTLVWDLIVNPVYGKNCVVVRLFVMDPAF